MHVKGTAWRWNRRARFILLSKVVVWALSDDGGEAARQAWALGKVLAIYLFFDDRHCMDEEGHKPGQVRFLSVKTVVADGSEYAEEVVEPQVVSEPTM
eukprot:45845-Eustigmatos_ZCMA.PRE.1